MTPIRYLFLGAGLLVSALADGVAFSEWPDSLTVGQPITLKWMGGTDAPTTITLLKGLSTNLKSVLVLTDTATDGEFSWTPPAGLEDSDQYAFEVSQGDDINYTAQLPLSGGVPASDDRTQAGVMNDKIDTVASTEADAWATPTMTDTASAFNTGASTSAQSTDSTLAASITSDAAKWSGTTGGTASQMSTQTMLASKMNTPFVGSMRASSTASASSAMQTNSADIALTAPLAAVAGSMALVLLLQ